MNISREFQEYSASRMRVLVAFGSNIERSGVSSSIFYELELRIPRRFGWPLWQAHLLEHLICMAGTRFLGWLSVSGRTDEHVVRIHAVSDRIPGRSQIASALERLTNEDFVSEIGVIRTECAWLKPEFVIPTEPVSVEEFVAGQVPYSIDMEIFLRILDPEAEIRQVVALVEDSWERTGRVVLKPVTDIDRWLRGHGFKFDFRLQMGPAQCPIHPWMPLLLGLSSYSSWFAQRLRSGFEGLYGFRIGLFPFQGVWNLFLTRLGSENMPDLRRIVGQLSEAAQLPEADQRRFGWESLFSMIFWLRAQGDHGLDRFCGNIPHDSHGGESVSILSETNLRSGIHGWLEGLEQVQDLIHLRWQ